MEEQFRITEIDNSANIKIVVVGVGGGGGNMVDNIADCEIADKVKIVAVNTDKQALDNSKVPHKVQIGEKITGGKGAGMNPSVGRDAALESYDAIKEAIVK